MFYCPLCCTIVSSQMPANTTICLGSVSELSCASTDAQTIFYLVNNTPATQFSPQQGIKTSAPYSIGNVTLVKLTIWGISAGVSQILCRILLTNGTFISSSTAYLTVQGNVWYVNVRVQVHVWITLLLNVVSNVHNRMRAWR